MLKTLDVRHKTLTAADISAILPRNTISSTEAFEVAQDVISDVRSRGLSAILEHAERYDGIAPSTVRMPVEYLEKSLAELDSAVRESLETSIARVQEASGAQMPVEHTSTFAGGGEVLQRWVPVQRVGLYVPGGKAVYPSSVVMNVIPAQVAGVPSIAIASPGQKEHDGLVHPLIAATAKMLGVTEVYAMGGATAIAAFAYGVAEIGLDPVSVITGPGNRFVAAAKRLVNSVVGIDAEAGPTEILIIADDTARADFVARDLISQAEHDEHAAAILVTTSQDLVEKTNELVRQFSSSATHSKRIQSAITGSQSACILVDDIATAIAIANAYAPEHLEIHTENARELVTLISNAGAVFVGNYSPVSVGDYMAGSNHVLPTFGQAQFSAALNTTTFLRSQQVISYTQEALSHTQSLVRALADAEDLPAHADAIDERFRDERPQQGIE